ncbi:probable glutamate receptor [Palaemon carinicauda]|uniref:probable glutamate receptor n=1 Tax=Palaemon carinicauda TaxID=392227 RepID=UPI0035B5B042
MIIEENTTEIIAANTSADLLLPRVQARGIDNIDQSHNANNSGEPQLQDTNINLLENESPPRRSERIRNKGQNTQLPGDYCNYFKMKTVHSNISADDAMKIVKVFVKNDSRELTILYGKKYEEAINKLAELVAEKSIVLMNWKNDGETETFRRMLSLSNRNCFLMLLDTPANIVSLFQKMRKKMLRTHLVTWLLLMEGTDAENNIVSLQEFVNEGTQVVIFEKKSDDHFIHYHHSVDAYGVTRFMNEGNWKGTNILKERLPKGPQQKHYNLSGRQFIVSVKEGFLVAKFGKVHPDGSVELESGADVDILNIVSSALNFTYKAYPPRDNSWGDVQPDGNVTGIIGMVARREATIGISALTYSDSRLTVIDFTSPYHIGKFLLMSRTPKEKNRALAVLSPFQSEIWFCVTLAVLLMGPVVYSIEYVVNKYVEDHNKIDFQWFHFNIFRSIVNQGNHIREESSPLRVVLTFWFLFCSVNAALYSGMLTATLAIPAYETPIDSLQDLPRATKEGFTIGTLAGGVYENFFKTATEGVIRQTWNLFNHEDRSKSFIDDIFVGVNRVLEEKFVFITGDGFARGLVEMYGNKFHFGKEMIYPSYMGIICQMGSPVTDTISRLVLRMREGGIVEKIANDLYRKIPMHPSATVTETKSASITLTHLQAAFYLFSLGIILSTVTLMMEKVSFCINGRNKFPP